MAIYHFSGSVVSRSKGKSAVASAAYRSGEKLHDERQEKTFDYGRKQGIVYKEIMLPDDAPEWMANREKLWNAVEAAENRKDSQLAREFNFALPREFTKEQNIELAREFIQNEFVAKGMVADLCIHDEKSKDGEEKPHAHVMLALRRVTKDGFGLKERSWNAKENLLQWREAWAEYTNKYLALNGIDQRVDNRTLEEQGIALEPQKKIGPDIFRVYEARVEEHRRIAKENGEKIFDDPTIALKAITHHQSTFTHQDLARFINRHSIDAEQFQMVYEKVKASEQIVTLVDEQGKERFTTREMQVLENKMLDDAISLKENANIAPRSVDLELPGTFLSPQQKDAVKHIIGDGDIKCLVGYAGTGKSRLLSQAKELWEKDGYRVHGATLSGIAAENLEATSGIESRTLASRCYYWDRGAEYLTKKDVLVIDEAGMLGSRQAARVLDEVKTAGAKAVFIGDPQQLQAIEAGAAFRAISEQTGYLELTEIRRQQEPWQQEATKKFALRYTQEALDLYEQHGCIHVFETQDIAKSALVERWDDARIDYPDKTQIMLSYTNRDAQELNGMARDYRRKNNELGEDQELKTESGNKNFAINDRIYFLRNNRSLGVKNGTLGTIENIHLKNKERGQVTVRLDRDDLNGNPKSVTIDLGQYGHITHGYAATIHKAQSLTVDQSHILASKHLDSHAAYVGMTRHKERADLYLSKEEFADRKELEQVLSRDRSKDVTLDYYSQNTREIEEREVSQETQTKEKSVSELVKEIASLGKSYYDDQGSENRVEQYVREIKEIAEQAEQDPEEQNIRQEIKALGEQDYLKIDKDRTDEDREQGTPFREKIDYPDPVSVLIVGEQKEAAIISQQEQKEGQRKEQHYRTDKVNKAEKVEPSKFQQEKQAENLINKHYGLEEKYREVKERRNKPFAEAMAKEQIRRCAQELYKNKYAMNYLEENDVTLFKEIKVLKEQNEKLEQKQKIEPSEAKLDRIIKECAVIMQCINSCNYKQAYYISEGTFSQYMKDRLDEHKDEIKQCIKEIGDDKKMLNSFRQRDSKLFEAIDKACDNIFTKSIKGIESKERLKGFAGNRPALYEKALLGEKEYRKLEQEHSDAVKGVAEMFTSGYGQSELKEPKAIRDSIGEALERCANTICKDVEATRLISQHDRELFRDMNKRFDNMFIEVIKKDDLHKDIKMHPEAIDKITGVATDKTLLEEERAEKLIGKYYAIEEKYHEIREKGESRFDEIEAKGQMGRCAHEICKSESAMNYLHKNDKELFEEMNVLKEQEKTHEKPKGFERKGFEMEI